MRVYINLIILLLLSFQIQVVEAKFDCGFLHPKLQDKDINIDGSIKAEAKGFISKIVGAEGGLKGKYFDQDSLVKYPNADKLARWYSIAYITCGMMNEDKISIDKKTEIYMTLMNLYAVLSGVEEKLKIENGIVDEFIPISINLEKYKIGRRPKDLGKNLLIKEFSTGEKYISGTNKNGFFEQENINAKPGSEISFSIKLNFNNSEEREIILISDKKEKFIFRLRGEFLQYKSKKIRIWSPNFNFKYFYDRDKNNFKFEIDDDLIVLSLNEKLVASITKQDGSIITSFIFRGLTDDGDGIYGFTVSKN